MRSGALAALLVLPGCLSLRAARPPAAARAARPDPGACAAYDRGVIGWTVTGIAAGSIGGSSTLVGLFTSSPGRYIAGGGAAVLSTFAAISAFLANRDAQRFTQAGCGGSP